MSFKTYDLTYNEFMAKVNAGEISELEVTPSKDGGIYTIEGKLKSYKENESFKVIAPLSDEVVKSLVDGYEKYDYKIEVNKEYLESSVNWKDDDEVVEFTLNQKYNNDKFMFKFGLLILKKSTIEKMIIQEKRDASFFGYETVDKLVDRIIIEKAKYNSIFHKIEHDISRSDIASCVLEDNSVEADPNEELKELIGLESVKKTINEIISQIKIHKSMSKDRKRRVKRPALHMMFTGNPGTGKTTVARIVAELFHKEGILSKGHLIEVKGRDLCAEYIGQTAPKTSGYCRDAYGSVLFIDEAYTLFTGDKDFKRDFGYEALATLVAEMENHRNDLCVILAGYTDEMKTMLKGNPGMESRIPYTVEFPNYSREELFKIFFMMVKGSGFKYEKKLESAVRNFFKKIPDAVLSSKDFSNARFVRNLFERTWGKAACRCSLSKEDIMLLASDLLGAADEGEFKQLMESKPRKSIGFGS